MSDTVNKPLKPMSLAGRTILGIYLLIMTGVLVYMLFAFWPAGNADTASGVSVTLFGADVSFSTEVQTLILIVVVAALGSNIHAATSFSDYAGNRRLYASWGWWYVLRLFIGISLALIVYFVIRGGFLAAGTQAGDVNIFGVVAVAGLVGMFSKQATDKLREVFDNLFRTEKPTERSGKLTNPVPRIESIDPAEVPAGTTGLSLTVNGNNFVEGAVIKLADRELVAQFISATQLTVSIPDENLIVPGSYEIKVWNPLPGGGESQLTKLTVR